MVSGNNSNFAGCRRDVRDVRPPMASYTPSLWGDTFSSFTLDESAQASYAEAIEAMKTDARSKLMAAKSAKLIALVDTLERLGLGYHFEKEIEEKLQETYELFQANDEYDLFTTALGFRLLRQHRYHVSCSVFEKFMDKDNKFKEAFSNDGEGLLSLYEATQIRLHGEDILEEAVAFTTHNLTCMLQQLESPLKDKVERALEQSLHRGVPIIQIRLYIPIYEKEVSRDELLLKLAKYNFNYLQNLYKKELCEVSRWWNKFDLKKKLLYSRDRLVECYLWGTAFHFEPQYSYVRIWTAKSMQTVSVIDDTYDNYATLEEAQLFTDALERWNMDAIDQIPDYMKIVYQFLMSTYEDLECDATKQEKLFVVPYFREAVKQLGRAYNKEQKWIMEREMPSFEEYFTNSVITSCIYVMFSAAALGMKFVTKETIDWLLSEPKLVISTAKMGRHLEDLGSHERENREGAMLTVVDCYTKQHSVSNEGALSKFEELVEDGWKNVNTEWVKKTQVPKEMVVQLLNYARVAQITYKKFEDGFNSKKYEDGYTNPEKVLAPYIVALFVDPTAI